MILQVKGDTEFLDNLGKVGHINSRNEGNSFGSMHSKRKAHLLVRCAVHGILIHGAVAAVLEKQKFAVYAKHVWKIQ